MSDLRIEGLAPLLPAEARPAQRAQGSGFVDVLTKAIAEVDGLQKEGDAQANQLAQGGGNLHETALALEKADVSMRVLVKVRNKLIDAYNEVMRMSA